MSQFVPSSAIAKLVEGSYEHLTARLDDLLAGTEGGIRRKVIATFAGHAIVAEEKGLFLKVSYAAAADGSLKVVGTEPLKVATYTPEQVTEFVFHEANDIVEGFLTGTAKDTMERVEGLLPFVTPNVRRKTEVEAVDAALAAVKADRVWRTLYRERADLIKSVLGDVKVEAVEPKFTLLTDGSIPAEKHDGYKELVFSDLTHLAQSADSLAESAEAALTMITEAKEIVDDAEQAATLVTFESFASDLVADLKGLVLLIGESLKNVKSVANLGKLYDGLASEFTHHKVAGRFVQEMADKLCATEE